MTTITESNNSSTDDRDRTATNSLRAKHDSTDSGVLEDPSSKSVTEAGSGSGSNNAGTAISESGADPEKAITSASTAPDESKLLHGREWHLPVYLSV
jgi:hypothetical protein